MKYSCCLTSPRVPESGKFLLVESAQGGGGGGGYSWEFLVGVCRPVPQIPTRFPTKKRNFSTPVFRLDL